MQKSYETKQYKRGLKAADAILKKFPEHGGMLINEREIICIFQLSLWKHFAVGCLLYVFFLFLLCTLIRSTDFYFVLFF